MMITVNSDQIVAVRNQVANVLVPVVLIRGYFTAVGNKTIHMATTEVEPEKKVSFLEKVEKAVLR